MTRLILAAVVLMVSISAHRPLLEVPNLSAEQLKKNATHIVVGEIRKAWSCDESDSQWKRTSYCAEIAVDSAEKGEINPGALLYARYWTKSWKGNGKPPADTNGYRGIPQSGQRLRVFLVRGKHDGFGESKDGGFNVLGPNGFQQP